MKKQIICRTKETNMMFKNIISILNRFPAYLFIIGVIFSLPTIVMAQTQQYKKRPTKGLFQKLKLIEYQFGSKYQYNITGGNLPSFFSATRANGTKCILSPDIPDTSGKMEYRGVLWAGEMNGYIWTPYVEIIGDIDLTTEDKITNVRSFNFEDYKKHNKVIPLANGYAINLFGAIIESDKIIKPGSSLVYTTTGGKKMYGRIIFKRVIDGKNIIEETILK